MITFKKGDVVRRNPARLYKSKATVYGIVKRTRTTPRGRVHVCVFWDDNSICNVPADDLLVAYR